jgi:predicted HicB family RNase H-like nuclease
MKNLQILVDHYTYRMEWSKEDDTHIARCLEFPSLAAHGDTSEKALTEIKKAVKASIKWMKEEKEEIPEPLGEADYSGNYALRMGKEKHRELTIEAKEYGISLNQLLLSKISR